MAPAYLDLRKGELRARADRAWSRLHRCTLCPRECGVDRLAGELGACRTGELARVHGAGPHFGEEAPLVGRGGSGTIFFAGCNLDCVFCQNHDISHPLEDRALTVTALGRAPESGASRGSERGAAEEPGRGGRQVYPRWTESPEYVARQMLRLQALGCENINLVSPSHVVPQILVALVLAAEGGLHLPLVYNPGGYDELPTLDLLDGVIDIYMPDMKYADNAVGERLSGVYGYASRNRVAVREMHRQVGDLVLDERGVARRGLLVRHLVLPGGQAGTAEVARFLATEVSPHTYINIMDQYRPAHRAGWHAEISRPPTPAEYEAAVKEARAAGLRRLDGQEGGG